jgi:hypothetical protein
MDFSAIDHCPNGTKDCPKIANPAPLIRSPVRHAGKPFRPVETYAGMETAGCLFQTGKSQKPATHEKYSYQIRAEVRGSFS